MARGNHPDQSATHDADFSAGGRRAAQTDGAATSGEPRGIDRALLLAEVARDARLDQKFLLLITLSAAIATLGLLQNSPAVVIGAMLVSPLLGPIMGIGFGLATLDSGLIKRSLITLGAGMLVAILIAMLLIWISPIQDVTAELRARTQPTLLDLGVAVVGGIAGVYAIMRKLSGVMVGVAIATALVPPLSTIGFGLATMRPDFALGAALLFLTNTLAIALAATVVARLSRFGPSLTPQHTAYQVIGIVAVLGILSIPLALSLNNIVGEIAARSAVQSSLENLLSANDRVDTLNVRNDGDKVVVDGVVLVAQYQPQLSARLQRDSAAELERPVDVNIVQLRQQSNAAVQVEDRINQRLTALERGDADGAAVLRELRVGDLLPRDQITLDAQSRRVTIVRDRDAEREQVAGAIDRILATARAQHPEWIIRSVAPQAEVPEAAGADQP